MIGEIKKRELLRKGYKDLVFREGRPDPNEIKEKIKEIGVGNMVSVIFFHSRVCKKVIFIHTGTIGSKFSNSLVFHLFPSGQVRHIPIVDIIDIIDPVYENLFPRRVRNDQKR